jgi:hypothetical protein
MLNTTANSSNNCTNPFHTYVAVDEFPLAETGELVFNKNPDKLFCVGGANDIRPGPHDSWSRTKSRRCFSDNNVTVAAALLFNRYT